MVKIVYATAVEDHMLKCNFTVKCNKVTKFCPVGHPVKMAQYQDVSGITSRTGKVSQEPYF